MKIVIDIPETDYNRIMTSNEVEYYELKIAQGQVLPKGHGDLIERDKLIQSIKENLIDTSNLHYENLVEAEGVNCGVESSLDDVNNAPTIIEADQGNKE